MENRLIISFVLYQTIFSKTPSYSVLKKLLLEEKELYLFVYDNSETIQTDEMFLWGRVIYIHDKENPGLAAAYNQASQYFHHIGGDLLLLLDQDTKIEGTYIEQLLHMEITSGIGAYVPIIISHGRQISPVYTTEYINRKSVFPSAGVFEEPIMAINSGTALSKETLQALGSFNQEFPLDFLDHWLFWQLQQLQKKVYVLEQHLIHDLSVLDYRAVSSKRYESIITAETLFYKKYATNKFRVHKKHLFLRTMKQFFCVKNRKIWRRTFSEYLALMKGK